MYIYIQRETLGHIPIYISRSVDLYVYIYIYYFFDGLPKYLFLVWLINRNSQRAVSCLVFKTICLNSLNLCMLFFMFETVAKTCGKMLTRVYMKWVPLLAICGGTGLCFHLLQVLSLPLLSLFLLLNRHYKIHKFSGILWWSLGHGLTKAFF